MNRAVASRLAQRWSILLTDADHPWGVDERTGRHRDAAREAVWSQLQEAVPEPDAAVAYRADDGSPTVAVLVAGALYLVRVPGFDGERAWAECRFIRLDPMRFRASVTSQHWRDGFSATTGSDWRFVIDDVETISVRTSTSTDDALSEDERFCRALAAKLGWEHPERTPPE